MDVGGAGGLLDEKGGDWSLVVGLVNTSSESEVLVVSDRDTDSDAP